MRTRGSKVVLASALAFLGAVHFLALASPWIATHAPEQQYRELPLAPPSTIHWSSDSGTLQAPFVYRWIEDSSGRFVEDRSARYPLHLFQCAETDSRRHCLLSTSRADALFLLGTDELGRDRFSRLIYGARISLASGWIGALAAVALGTLAGVVSGYFGGWIDDAVMRMSEIFLVVPWIFLLFALRALLPSDLASVTAFLLLMLTVGALGWARPARIVRSVVLGIRQRGYVMAARGVGASHLSVMLRHVLPQTSGVVWTQLALLLPQFLLAEALLSFLGLGVAPPHASWGGLLAPLRRYAVLESQVGAALPVLALLIGVVLSFEFLAALLRRRSRVPTP